MTNDYGQVLQQRDEARAAAAFWESRYSKAMGLLAATVDLANLVIAADPDGPVPIQPQQED